MTVFFTADWHFNHQNILKYCPTYRPYADADEMNEALLRRWNQTVQEQDTVYCLGDMAFGNQAACGAILAKLNGRKILLRGNHDEHSDAFYRRYFEEVHPYLERRFEGQNLVLFHYPIANWNGAGQGAIHLHGHEHGRAVNIGGKRMDVGYDVAGRLFSLAEVLDMMAAE